MVFLADRKGPLLSAVLNRMEGRATENRASESAGADSGFGRSPRNQRKRFAHEVRGEASIAFHAMEKRFRRLQ
jgi:hypothetical protein